VPPTIAEHRRLSPAGRLPPRPPVRPGTNRRAYNRGRQDAGPSCVHQSARNSNRQQPAVSIGTQKGPSIGVQKGPRSLRSVSVDGCFFVRLKRSVSSSRPDDRRAPRAAAVKDGRRPSPEAARSVLDGGEHDARLGQDGSDQARFLKRQLSLPVSMMSQWCVRRSRSAVVILASPKTLGHSPNARFVVMITEACS
jgi:hypothetical protein